MKKHHIIIFIIIILLLIVAIFLFDMLRTIEKTDEDIYQKAVELLGENTVTSKSPYAYKIEESANKLIITTYSNDKYCPRNVYTYYIENDNIIKLELSSYFNNKYTAMQEYNGAKKRNDNIKREKNILTQYTTFEDSNTNTTKDYIIKMIQKNENVLFL